MVSPSCSRSLFTYFTSKQQFLHFNLKKIILTAKQINSWKKLRYVFCIIFYVKYFLNFDLILIIFFLDYKLIILLHCHIKNFERILIQSVYRLFEKILLLLKILSSPCNTLATILT